MTGKSIGLALSSVLLVTSQAWASEIGEAAESDPPVRTTLEPNQAPVFQIVPPYNTPQHQVRVRVGQKVRFVVHAHDPDGNPLVFSARGLPQGAQFDPETQVFSWTPTKRHEGQHTPIFEVSDGRATSTLLILLEVMENRPPVSQHRHFTVQVGRKLNASIATSDPDGDRISYAATNMPEGMSLDPRSGRLRWSPTVMPAQTTRFKATASDGQSTSEFWVVVHVKPEPPEVYDEPESEWESFLQPGVGYSLYAPNDNDTFGLFHGVDLELVFVSWIHRNDNRGPSHGRFYMKGEILRSSKEDVTQLFLYSLGLSLSLERNPGRNWLIPHYGIEFGGLTQENIGGDFQSTVLAGVHLWSSPNLFINLDGGYMMVPSDMKDLGGWHAGLNVDFSLW